MARRQVLPRGVPLDQPAGARLHPSCTSRRHTRESGAPIRRGHRIWAGSAIRDLKRDQPSSMKSFGSFRTLSSLRIQSGSATVIFNEGLAWLATLPYRVAHHGVLAGSFSLGKQNEIVHSGSLHCPAASTKLLKGGSITRLLIFVTADVAVPRNLI
jgi:hypothetical protein